MFEESFEPVESVVARMGQSVTYRAIYREVTEKSGPDGKWWEVYYEHRSQWDTYGEADAAGKYAVSFFTHANSYKVIRDTITSDHVTQDWGV